MLEGFLFKNKKNGVNHIAIGIDPCKSLCGAVTYSSKSSNPDMKRVGEKMPLDDLLYKFSKYCSRCYIAAEKQVESDLAYQIDSEQILKEKRGKKSKILF